jgi:hypothetical protein
MTTTAAIISHMILRARKTAYSYSKGLNWRRHLALTALPWTEPELCSALIVVPQALQNYSKSNIRKCDLLDGSTTCLFVKISRSILGESTIATGGTIDQLIRDW